MCLGYQISTLCFVSHENVAKVDSNINTRPPLKLFGGPFILLSNFKLSFRSDAKFVTTWTGNKPTHYQKLMSLLRKLYKAVYIKQEWKDIVISFSDLTVIGPNVIVRALTWTLNNKRRDQIWNKRNDTSCDGNRVLARSNNEHSTPICTSYVKHSEPQCD